MKAEAFVHKLLERRYDFFTGVPCSFLKPLINFVIDSPRCDYLPSTIEGEGAAIAAGAWLTGKKPVVLLQNSGLGNLVNTVTSLNRIYHIPALFLVTWRSGPGLEDAAQHKIMGEITPDLLSLMGVPYAIVDKDEQQLSAVLDEADRSIERERRPFACIVRKDIIEPNELKTRPNYERPRNFESLTLGTKQPPAERDAATEQFAAGAGEHPVIATTGFTSRALYNAGDRSSYFYMQGSMGFASSIGLGVSSFHPGPVFVLDGDGALLMRMSVLSTLGAFHRGNLTYVVFDNNVHDSTGGQVTISSNLRFDKLADAVGFDRFVRIADYHELSGAMQQAAAAKDSATFIYLKTQPGAGQKMGRPDITPPQIADRFRERLAQGTPSP